jgi:hypothetical protein
MLIRMCKTNTAVISARWLIERIDAFASIRGCIHEHAGLWRVGSRIRAMALGTQAL